MNNQPFDKIKSRTFGQEMISVLNHGALALMLSVGHQTGLFDCLAGLPPSTSKQIAAAAGLQERYVREWLGAMVTGRVIDYQADNELFYLSPEHARWLSTKVGNGIISMWSMYIPLLSLVEEKIIDSFKYGGGVPYSEFQKFQDVMGQLSTSAMNIALLDKVLPMVPGISDRLQKGIQAADIGCGQGVALTLMGKAYPASQFTGYDFSADGIAAGKAEAVSQNLNNVSFVEKDVALLEESGAFDFITAFDAIHDQAQPTKVLAAIYRALRPGGTFLMMDIAASSHLHENIDNPVAPLMYTTSCMHCMTVSLAVDGEGLGAMWGKQKALEMLNLAGFAQVDVRQLPSDMFNYYYIAQKETKSVRPSTGKKGLADS